MVEIPALYYSILTVNRELLRGEISMLFLPNFWIVISTGDFLAGNNEMKRSDNRLCNPEDPISRSSWENKSLINRKKPRSNIIFTIVT
jgi:hypothetical protein